MLIHVFSLRLVVTATDRGNPRLAGSATLTVIITDLNDNSPMIPLPQEVHVPESKSVSLSVYVTNEFPDVCFVGAAA